MTYISSQFYCTNCGDSYDIPRIHKQREKYHMKTLYCRSCRKEEIFIEIRECDHDLKTDKVIKYGILRYFYQKYGYDFLKLFIWFPEIVDREELDNIIWYINGSLSKGKLQNYYAIIKPLSKAVREHRPELWRQIREKIQLNNTRVKIPCPHG